MRRWRTFLLALHLSHQSYGLIVRAFGSTSGSNEVTLKWMAPADQAFRIEFADTLPAEWKPLPGTISVTNGEFLFVSFSPQIMNQRFFRVVRVQ
jgi:hypothetical protein